MARGRIVMLATGMKMGQARAHQGAAQAAALKDQGAAEAKAQAAAAHRHLSIGGWRGPPAHKSFSCNPEAHPPGIFHHHS